MSPDPVFAGPPVTAPSLAAREFAGCGRASHLHRRTVLRAAAGLAGVGWWTRIAEHLARASDSNQPPPGKPAQAVIMVWLQGGPSQLETFDPHPGTEIAGGTKAIKTSAPDIQIAEHYPRLADQMHHVALVRSLVSKEGDHERASYQGLTGYRPDPTVIHPSLGAILCHQSRDNLEIPRHVSIFPSAWPARGGYLGDQYDAFKTGDPVGPVPDIRARVSEDRYARRMEDLQKIVEPAFARGRLARLDEAKTLHRTTVNAARLMMSSDQLKAFDVTETPKELRAEFGDSPFGRGCLAAARLIETGVRCVEVTLNGWDTHANNHEGHRTQAALLDPALSALLRYLHDHELLDRTIVMCGGEFGRTPRINPAGGRDHWPHGFTIALAGGGVRGGIAIGETSPEMPKDGATHAENVAEPYSVADIHATMLDLLGVDHEQEIITPIGRPLRLSDGTPIERVKG